MAYFKDEGYTYSEVKTLIRTSQTRGNLFTGGAVHGHASSLHQVITDTDLKNRLKKLSAASAFKDKADTNFGATIKTEDQAFLLTEILNSKLGRAALQALDAVPGGTIARLSICYLVGNSSSFALREAKLAAPAGVSMNQAKMDVQMFGVVDASTPMEQIIACFDNGYPTLQVVTAYPASDSTAGIAEYGNYGGYSVQHQGGAPAVVKWTA
jgi:hypothetical protein